MSLQKLGDQNHLAQIENKLGITVFHLIYLYIEIIKLFCDSGALGMEKSSLHRVSSLTSVITVTMGS